MLPLSVISAAGARPPRNIMCSFSKIYGNAAYLRFFVKSPMRSIASASWAMPVA